MREITRTVDELIARYELNPRLCDVYVEGDTDRGILEGFFLDEREEVEAIVYDIDTVRVPSSIIASLGLENNNRGRVIALARILYEKLGAALPVTGVIDADLDYALGSIEPCPLILATDYSSIEMYFFNSKALTKFIRSICPSAGISAERVLKDLQPVLKQLFLARVANRVLNWRLKAVSIRRSLTIEKAGHISLDFADFVARYLNKNAYLGRRGDFLNAIRKWEPRCRVLDDRCCMHGHDFLDVLAMICSKVKAAAEIRSGNVVGGMLRCAVSHAELASEPMFRRLIERCTER